MEFYGSPTYSVKFYKDGLYKLIKFNSPRGISLHDRDDDHDRDHEGKFDAALSRAKSVIYQLAICNEWDYFFTGTLSPDDHNRFDLFAFRNQFAQFVRDLRKKSGYENLAYLLIPERHKDGAWHMHGLIAGLPEDALSYFVPGIHPASLVDGGFRNWPAYSDKFGYCSLGRVRDPDAVSAYLVKYISKDMQSSVTEVGGHTYYCTRGLKRAVPYGYVFGGHIDLDRFLDTHAQFCSTGMVRDVSWSFWLDYIDYSRVDFVIQNDNDYVDVVFVPDQGEQQVISGFPLSQYISHYRDCVYS